MRTRTKWIAGLIVISLSSAILASLFTAFFLVRSLLHNRGMGWLALMPGQTELTTPPSLTNQATLTTGSTEQTTQATAIPLPTRQPTSQPSPTAIPSPIPEATPTSQPEPSLTPVQTELNATEALYLWQTRQMVQRIFEEVAPTVVRVQIYVPASGTLTARTNEASGLIIDAKGLIVTDATVLSVALDKNGRLLPGARIDIVMQQAERILSATYLGRDQVTGVAALLASGNGIDFKVPRFAQTPDLRVGQMILSVGFPDQLVTAGGLSSGFISALNRTVVLESGLEVQMIQTDLQINARYSGGPLLNLQGEVIGLANCGLAQDPLNVRMNALPIDALLSVARSLDSEATATGRSWLGITVLNESSFLELQRLYRFPDGLFISSVIQDSPAYVADLRKNDVIIQINDEPVSPTTDLSSFLQEQPVGAAVRLRVFRRTDFQTIDLVVYLQELRP